MVRRGKFARTHWDISGEGELFSGNRGIYWMALFGTTCSGRILSRRHMSRVQAANSREMLRQNGSKATIHHAVPYFSIDFHEFPWHP